MTHRKCLVAALAACAGIAVPALAQDSITNAPGPNTSDALNPWDPANQCNEFIVNLTPIQSSWNTPFATGVIVKSSKTSSGFESSLISAQSISRSVIPGQLKFSYDAWNTAGAGVNPLFNNAPATVFPSTDSVQMGYGFSEFATSDDLTSVNQIIGGLIQLNPRNSCKLYVNRQVAVTNTPTGIGGFNAAIGFGAVDAHGNLAMRADDFGAGGGAPVAGNNIFRVGSKDRDCMVVNDFSGLGFADPGASKLVIGASGTTYSTPNILPEELGGPLVIGTNFNTEYYWNDNGGVAIVPGSAADIRGTLAFSNVSLFGDAGAVGSAGTLGKDAAGATRNFRIWDVDGTGAPTVSALDYASPAGLDDPCDMRDDAVWNAGFFEFDHYHSQAPFQGGNSQLALGQDQSGALLAAAVAYKVGGNTDPTNAIGVLRDTTPGQAGGEQWSMAAWNGNFTFVLTGAGRGKAVLDGPGGNEIGYIVTLPELTNFAVSGPSITAASFDSMGNLWFVAPVWFPPVLPVQDFDFVDQIDCDACLIRAVYVDNGVANSPCWELEVVLRAGDIIHGVNSDRDFSIGFIQIADNNSVSSGAFWSQNSTQDAFAGMSTVGMAPKDNRSSGGVLLSCEITYDANNDGVFDFTTLTSDDESYNVVLYVGANTGICADLNNDGVVDTADLGVLLGQFGTAGPNADLNCDGRVDTADLGILLGQFGMGC
ncbi:MAG: hypothetical protein H6814_11325 [Phycisphaeraceae bacterium]|nr:hypothetical protein [Phycisphaeraceae bacterium]